MEPLEDRWPMVAATNVLKALGALVLVVVGGILGMILISISVTTYIFEALVNLWNHLFVSE